MTQFAEDFTITQEQADTLNARIAQERGTTMQTTASKITTVTRATLTGLYNETGGHFFDADSMRFFNSRIAERVYEIERPDGSVFVFVTSEKHDHFPRRYSVRVWNGINRSIDTYGDFQAHATREEAAAAAKDLAQYLANN